MIARRRALALLGGGFAALACGPRRPPTSPPRPAASPIALPAAVDLVASAGLVWLVDVRPRALLSSPDVASAVLTVVPAARFDAFAEHDGGVDLRRIEELAIAQYPSSLLAVVRGSFSPARVASAFEARADPVLGKQSDGAATQVWGSVGGAPERVWMLGESVLAFVRGDDAPLLAAAYFARRRLRRSLPALRADPLALAASLVGDAAPVRAFAPGPFSGPWAAGLGGLLGAATAVAASLAPAPGRSRAALAGRIVLTGAWGGDAPAAADRLRAAYDVLANDALGKLVGLDRPLAGPDAKGTPEALQLRVDVDGAELARGLHAAVDASVAEIFSF